MHEAGRKDKLYVASLSGGKDSTAMVLRLVEEQRPLDFVLFCDTGLEFPQMYDHVRKVEQAINVPVVWLKAEQDFEYYMFHFTPDRKPGSTYMGKTGMSWAGPKNRWCTKRLKTQVIDQYLSSLRKEYEILKKTGKPFQFRQGLDERLLDDRKCAALFSSRYDDSYSFAFDNVADAELIEKKIILARKYTDAKLRFYCFCGFDREGKWDRDFWAEDVFSLLKRIEILMRHECLAYVMRFNRYVESPFRGVYVSIARWANQPGMFKKESLREYAEKNGRGSACFRYLDDFERQFPQAAYFYDLKYETVSAEGRKK